MKCIKPDIFQRDYLISWQVCGGFFYNPTWLLEAGGEVAETAGQEVQTPSSIPLIPGSSGVGPSDYVSIVRSR